MRTNKKLLAASVLASGALVSAGIGVGTAASAPSTHTLSFRAIQLNGHNVGKNGFINTEKDVKNGKYIGNDILDGTYNRSTGAVTTTVSLALKGGTLTGHFKATGNTAIHGKVIGGTGKYKGVTGTLSGTNGPHGSENVTIVYS